MKPLHVEIDIAFLLNNKESMIFSEKFLNNDVPMVFIIEQFFYCPYCNEQISILIDSLQTEQEYIEDCEVCCNPISLKIHISEGEVTYFSANNLED